MTGSGNGDAVHPGHGERVGELDLLRFLAAFAVVMYHYAFRGYAADAMTAMPYPILSPVAKYGYLGVQLFFLISGFVILMSASSGSLRRFFVSRAARLYPAFWACCTLSFLAILLCKDPQYHASVSDYLLNLTMLGDFIGAPPIDGVYWSLFVELRFYALVALILLLGQIHRIQLILLAWLAITVALQFRPSDNPELYLAATYSAYFIAGATAYLVHVRGLCATRAGMYLVAWLVALYQADLALAALRRHYHTSWSPVVTAGLITGCFVALGLIALRRTGSFARLRWLAIGALTYPLYLLHQQVGFMIFNLAYPAINPNVLLWGTVALMLGAAHLVHVLIERPGAPLLRRGLGALAAVRSTHRAAGAAMD